MQAVLLTQAAAAVAQNHSAEARSMQDPGHWLCLAREENRAASLTKTPLQQTLPWCPRLCCLGRSSHAKKADQLAAAYSSDTGRKKKTRCGSCASISSR